MRQRRIDGGKLVRTKKNEVRVLVDILDKRAIRQEEREKTTEKIH